MAVSMTGFGRGKAETDRFSITVEIKTVNHRFCEYNIRMPRQLLNIEEKMKKKIGKQIKRGRIEVYVTLEGEGTVNRRVNIDWDLLDEYHQYIMQIKEKYSLEGNISIEGLLGREEIIQIQEEDAGNEELEGLVLASVEKAVNQLKEMRIQEGKALQRDLTANLFLLRNHATALKEYAPRVIEQYERKLAKRMAEFFNGNIDENRILMEVAIFADKADIHEELTRIHSHAQQFEETILRREPIGRKLDFLIQEMLREVNTIGAKANDSSIAREVVEMKSLLEKMKEQVQNIE